MTKVILVTGATGKVGRVFIQRLLADPKFNSFTVRALCHNREFEPHERIQNFHGSIEHREVVEKAMDGVTHVLHLATVKETPEQIMESKDSHTGRYLRERENHQRSGEYFCNTDAG